MIHRHMILASRNFNTIKYQACRCQICIEDSMTAYWIWAVIAFAASWNSEGYFIVSE
jgi:hypothetical protein